jgi:hypothetical protein
MNVLLQASGCTDFASADDDFVHSLRSLVFRGRHVLLAFDHHYTEDGKIDLQRTGMYTPNERVHEIAGMYPEAFIAACSVHPYRPDAVEELERCHKRGTRIIKWLPNAMGIDPCNSKCDVFYSKVRELDMVLLVHVGEEKAVPSDPRCQAFGSPSRLVYALQRGVKVILAHCASLGKSPDWENNDQMTDCFEVFLRMMHDKRWEGLLFADISAVTLNNRMHVIPQLLQATEIHHRLINVSCFQIHVSSSLLS